MLKKTSTLRLACILSGFLMLAACGTKTESPQTVPTPQQATPEKHLEPLTMQAKEVMAEYQKATSEFPEALPSGVSSFPNTLPAAFLKSNYVAEPGAGDGVAAFYWLCAWQDAFLTAQSTGDRAAADEAFERLNSGWEELPFYKNHVEDPHQVWRKEILGPALEGNDRPLKGYFNNGCSFYKEHNPS